MHLKITTDGEAKPNPGRMRVGVLIEDVNDATLKAISQDAGIGSNNMAEYLAIIKGLEEAVNMGASSATIYTDSRLVDRQLRGVYSVKNAALKKLHGRAVSLSSKLSTVRYRWHSREEPKAKIADALAEGGAKAARILEDLCQTTKAS